MHANLVAHKSVCWELSASYAKCTDYCDTFIADYFIYYYMKISVYVYITSLYITLSSLFYIIKCIKNDILFRAFE